jgi:transcriptional regulator with XRE-family HTH domain
MVSSWKAEFFQPIMDFRQALGLAIRSIRKSRKLSQEQFDVVSSRTYMSVLERGKKSPTLDKLHEISSVLGVHPAALVCVAYSLLEGEGKPMQAVDHFAQETRDLLLEIAEADSAIRSR